MKKIGHGIFMWGSPERQTNRYGAFTMSPTTYSGRVSVTPFMDLDTTLSMEGKRVRLVAKVIEARESGHAGDHFLKVYPSQPEVGEEIELGVGLLSHTKGYNGIEWVLEPNDGRKELWLDPRKLYRLHDQTVEIYMEETSADFSTPSDLTCSNTSGVIANGDGTFQSRTPITNDTVLSPKVTKLGEGLFAMSMDFKMGERVKIAR